MVVSRDGDAAEGVSPISELQECEHAIIASDSESYLAATTRPPVTRTSSLEELTLLNHRARGYVDCGSTFVTVPEQRRERRPGVLPLLRSPRTRHKHTFPAGASGSRRPPQEDAVRGRTGQSLGGAKNVRFFCK